MLMVTLTVCIYTFMGQALAYLTASPQTAIIMASGASEPCLAESASPARFCVAMPPLLLPPAGTGPDSVVCPGLSFIFNVFNGFARPYPEMPDAWKWLNRCGHAQLQLMPGMLTCCFGMCIGQDP